MVMMLQKGKSDGGTGGTVMACRFHVSWSANDPRSNLHNVRFEVLDFVVAWNVLYYWPQHLKFRNLAQMTGKTELPEPILLESRTSIHHSDWTLERWRKCSDLEHRPNDPARPGLRWVSKHSTGRTDSGSRSLALASVKERLIRASNCCHLKIQITAAMSLKLRSTTELTVNTCLYSRSNFHERCTSTRTL